MSAALLISEKDTQQDLKFGDGESRSVKIAKHHDGHQHQ
jgi:hypothetical protein